jgi:hypothetical protein
MPAVEVAPGGTLPEKVVEFMDFYLVVPKQPEKEWIHSGSFYKVMRFFLIFVQGYAKTGFYK